MADDGGWSSGSGFGVSDAADARTARARFHDVLAEFTARLQSPEPMRRETAVALVRQMDLLARRMASDDDAAQGQTADLQAAINALNARLASDAAAAAAREAQLTERLDRTLDELAEVRATKRPLFGTRAVRLVVSAAALCVALSSVGMGFVVLNRPKATDAPAPVAAAVVGVEAEDFIPAAIVRPATPAAPTTGLRALVRPATPTPAPTPAPGQARELESYTAVEAALDRGDPTAVRRLTLLARGGDAKAQLRLGVLYEAGKAGLERDLVAARLWTLRAAKSGDRVAMYNAALFFADGDGGPKDPQAAADWLRKAAERGVVDAQYNLGLMYEGGQGIDANPGEARRWYAMAAKAGDAAAAAKVADLEPPSQRPEPTVAPAPMGDRTAVADAQEYLAQQGYYIGPVDGLPSPALKAAAAAYARDHPGRMPSL